jgi:hypothetical protein
MSAHDKLFGTWRLIAATSEDISTGQKTSIHGRRGFINYGSDGRVYAILVDSDRKKPVGDIASAAEAEALFRSMVAYSGTYSIEDNYLVHHVDTSWNEAWTGTDQVRKYKFDGEHLILVDGPSPNPRTGQKSLRMFVWERVK